MICGTYIPNKSPAVVRGFLLVLAFFFFQEAWAEEQQSQGYRFEQKVIRQFTGKENFETSYTSKWDIPAEFNTATGRPVSVKCIRWGNSVYLGDALRQRKISEPFEMVIGFYEADKKKGLARLKALHHLTIRPEDWNRWWGGITFEEIERLNAGIKNKPLEEAQAFARDLAAKLRKKPGIVDLNPKVNKDQRRIQCSIPFNVFFREIIGREPEAQVRFEILGKDFPESFRLGARSRYQSE